MHSQGGESLFRLQHQNSRDDLTNVTSINLIKILKNSGDESNHLLGEPFQHMVTREPTSKHDIKKGKKLPIEKCAQCHRLEGREA